MGSPASRMSQSRRPTTYDLPPNNTYFLSATNCVFSHDVHSQQGKDSLFTTLEKEWKVPKVCQVICSKQTLLGGIEPPFQKSCIRPWHVNKNCCGILSTEQPQRPSLKSFFGLHRNRLCETLFLTFAQNIDHGYKLELPQG